MPLPEPPDEPAAATSTPEGATAVAPEDPLYARTVARIAQFVAARQCVLFLGSAAHAPAPAGSRFKYPATKCPPVGSGLSEILAQASDYPDEDWWNLPRVAQHYESSPDLGRFLLVEEIKRAVHVGKEPSPALRMLAELEFPVVITTNYDHLYEQALDLKAAGERAAAESLAGEAERAAALERVTRYAVSIYRPHVFDKDTGEKVETLDCPPLDSSRPPDPRRPFVLKIHGDVSRPESLVVTDEDYIQFVLRMSDQPPYNPFGKNVLVRLTEWPTLFIGYRLVDYNLRLLFKTLRWRLDRARIPPSYSVDVKPDKLIRDVWESQRRYVSFVVRDLWDFIPRLYEAVKGEPPSKFYAPD